MKNMPPPQQVQGLLEEIVEFLQLQFLVRVVSAFPSPFGIGLFEFQNPVQRACLLDASPIETDFGVLRVRKHDEVGNL